MERLFTRPRLVIAAAVVLSALVPLCIWRGWLRLEVPGQHWFLHDPRAPRPFLLWPLGALALLLIALGRALVRQARARAGLVLLAALVASYLMSVGVRSSSAMGFTTLALTVAAEGSNSYYLTAMRAADPLALARDYPRQMPHLPLHATTQSPGAMLLHAGLRRALIGCPAAMALAETLLWLHPCHRPSEVVALVNPLMGLSLQPQDVSAALLIALLFPLGMALGVLPLYGLARRLGGVRPALVLVALYAVTPSFIWFTASVDQVYITVALLVAWLCLVGVRERKPGLVGLGGAIAGATVFLNLGFLLLVGIGALFVLLLEIRASRHRRWVWRFAPAGLFAACALLALVAVCLAYGVNLPAVILVSADLRRALYRDLHRGYLTWLLLNPLEFCLGLGFSGAALVAAAALAWRRHPWPAMSLVAAAGLALAGLALLGQVRGETSRMLMFVMPLLLAGSAATVRQLRLDRLAPAFVLILAQAAYAVSCYHLFDVWGDWIEPLR